MSMWIARDKYRGLHLFNQKPVRNWSTLRWETKDAQEPFELNFNLFNDLSWEDEPSEVKLYEIDPTYKIKCKHCNKEIKYKRKDVMTDRNYQPSSGYDDEREYIICPECGGYIVI